MTDVNTVPAQGTLTITRVIDAPRELVWQAWTEAEHLMQWWSPKHYTTPHCKIDLRIGGQYHTAMRSAEGHDVWTTGTYREVDSPSRLVFTDSFADEQGNIVDAAELGFGDMPREMLVVVTLEDLDGKTRLTLEHRGVPAGAMSDGTAMGWSESFDKLEQSLQK